MQRRLAAERQAVDLLKGALDKTEQESQAWQGAARKAAGALVEQGRWYRSPVLWGVVGLALGAAGAAGLAVAVSR